MCVDVRVSNSLRWCFPEWRLPASDTRKVLGETWMNLFYYSLFILMQIRKILVFHLLVDQENLFFKKNTYLVKE